MSTPLAVQGSPLTGETQERVVHDRLALRRGEHFGRAGR
jgi:hypothetical protein